MTSATYAVGREKVREYAYAVGESEPRYLDVETARAAGYADVIAPPMFAAVYCGPAIWPAIIDPEVGHRLRAHGPRRAGVHLARAGRRRRRDHHRGRPHGPSERGGLKFFVFTTRSTNQDGELVCEGRWTNIVR